jgi:hypothetical protein
MNDKQKTGLSTLRIRLQQQTIGLITRNLSDEFQLFSSVAQLPTLDP